MSEIVNKKRKGTTRQRRSDDSDDDAGVDLALLDDILQWQKARKRPKGLSVEELNSVKDASGEPKVKEGKKLKVGGYVDAKTLQEEMEAEDIHQITSFAVETNKRDEDEPMKRYVEEGLSKIKGANKMEDVADNLMVRQDDMLFALPENIKQLAPKKTTEETLSDQMLSGIPEVDLGIEVKIKNIEATEEAKMKLLRERLNRKDRGAPEFVPSNIAVNFVQHNRFNLEENNMRRPQAIPKPTPIDKKSSESAPNSTMPSKSTHPNQEKATDDFHFEKFKRHMRRF